jgi:hypothetical protein
MQQLFNFEAFQGTSVGETDKNNKGNNTTSILKESYLIKQQILLFNNCLF